MFIGKVKENTARPAFAFLAHIHPPNVSIIRRQMARAKICDFNLRCPFDKVGSDIDNSACAGESVDSPDRIG
jgi:hypothetical protein